MYTARVFSCLTQGFPIDAFIIDMAAIIKYIKYVLHTLQFVCIYMCMSTSLRTLRNYVHYSSKDKDYIMCAFVSASQNII